METDDVDIVECDNEPTVAFCICVYAYTAHGCKIFTTLFKLKRSINTLIL